MKLDQFERKFVFRISRGIFVFIASLVSVTLAASVCYLAYTLSPTLKGSPPAKPKPPAEATVSGDEVQKVLEGMKSRQAPPPPTEAQPESEAIEEQAPGAAANSKEIRLAQLVEQMHQTYFPNPGFPWESVYETRCAVRHPYFINQCIRTEQRMTREGVSDLLRKAWTDLSIDDKILLLESQLQILPLVGANDDSRLLAFNAVNDISRAYKSPPKKVYDQIATMFKPDKQKSPVPEMTDEQKTAVLRMLTSRSARKSGSNPLVLVAFLRLWNETASLFAAESQVEGMVRVWNAVKMLFEDQVPQVVHMLSSTLQNIAQEDRVRAVDIFSRLLAEKNRSAQQSFERQMADYQGDLEKMEMDYEARKTAKVAGRIIALGGVGGALFGIALLGLLLSLLGVERNTRTLEQLLQKLDRDVH